MACAQSVRIDVQKLGHIGDAGDIKRACKLGSDLRRVAVDGHLAAHDEVRGADLFDAQRERVGRGERIGAGKGAVGEQQTRGGAARDAVT